MAVAIILGPLPRVGQGLISFVDLFELLFGFGTLVPVRMILQGLLAEGFANLFLGIVPGYPQDFVVVPFWHLNSPVSQHALANVL